jgi:hypothetical protein
MFRAPAAEVDILPEPIVGMMRDAIANVVEYVPAYFLRNRTGAHLTDTVSSLEMQDGETIQAVATSVLTRFCGMSPRRIRTTSSAARRRTVRIDSTEYPAACGVITTFSSPIRG